MNIGMEIAKDLNKPLNPFIFALIGLVTVVYGLYLLVPKTNAYTLSTYSLFEDYNFDLYFASTGLVIGLWVFLTPKISKQISKMIIPLYFMAIYWLTIGVFIFIGNWHSNGWILPVFMSVLSIIAAANFSVNRNTEYYNSLMKK